MLSKKILLLSIVFTCVALFSGCASNDSSGNKILLPDVPVQKLNFPEAKYNYLGWHPQKGLIAATLDYGNDQFNLAFEDNSEFSTPILPKNPACQHNMQYFPGDILPDGRMALIKHCYKDSSLNNEDTSVMVAYDFASGTLQQIVAGYLPSWSHSKGFAWNPTMTRGVQELTDRLFSTLYWISPEGSSPIPLTLRDGNRSWSLEEQYNDMTNSNEGGSQYGYAGYPAWSPDGKTVAFCASFDAMGHTGITRVDGEFYLVFLDPNDLSYRFVLKDLYDPYGLEWSPDGKWLAFLGDVGSISEKGFWLYSLTENTLTKIGDKQYFIGPPKWSPDGRAIAIIACNSNTALCDKTEILKYDLTEVVP